MPKIKLGKSRAHLSRKAMLLIYVAIVGIGIVVLVGFGLNLAISKSDKTITPQKQISIDQEKIDELENFEYLGRDLDLENGVGRTDPF